MSAAATQERCSFPARLMPPSLLRVGPTCGLTEYTVSVKLKTAIVLDPGTYWLNVTPQCANPSDSTCSSALFYESDVEDSSPANHVGPANVLDDSFFNSGFFSSYYAPTWGGSGACTGTGCDTFSFGLIGKQLTPTDYTPSGRLARSVAIRPLLPAGGIYGRRKKL